MTYLLKATSFLCALILSGCIPIIHTVNSIDAKIERRVVPDTGEYLVTLSMKGKEPVSKRLKLEKYYDAQSSVRGNYWSWRVAGEDYRSPVKIEAQDEKFGEIIFTLMFTDELERKPVSDYRAMVIEVDGTNYWPSRNKNEKETFLTYDIKGNVTDSIELFYRIDIQFIPDAQTQKHNQSG